jgi:hypothetical protein
MAAEESKRDNVPAKRADALANREPAVTPPSGTIDPVLRRLRSERRSGFAAGLWLGAGIASVAGYPNESSKIGRKEFYTDTGLAPTAFGAGWVGYAITDWLTLGIGFGGGDGLVGDKNALTWGGSFHIEAFPFFSLGKQGREFALMLDFGVGMASVTPNHNDKVRLIESSTASLIGVGVFYEGIRFGHFSTGPFISGNYFFSNSAQRPGLFAGWRIAFYGGP